MNFCLLIKAMMSDRKSLEDHLFLCWVQHYFWIFIPTHSHWLKRWSCSLRSSSLALRSCSWRYSMLLHSSYLSRQSSSFSLQWSSFVCLCWQSACMSHSRSMTSLLSPLCFVDVQLVEESLEDGKAWPPDAFAGNIHLSCHDRIHRSLTSGFLT